MTRSKNERATNQDQDPPSHPNAIAMAEFSRAGTLRSGWQMGRSKQFTSGLAGSWQEAESGSGTWNLGKDPVIRIKSSGIPDIIFKIRHFILSDPKYCIWAGFVFAVAHAGKQSIQKMGDP